MGERVLVLGGGLAGVACARELGDDEIEVTLVDRNDYNQFQPLLYQVASSQLPAEDIARPHRTIFAEYPSVDVVTAQVTAADMSARSLTLADGRTLQGSHLVMAAGARPNFFGVPGLQSTPFRCIRWPTPNACGCICRGSCKPLWTIRRPRARFDRCSCRGGGPTGVETTGALAELMLACTSPGGWRCRATSPWSTWGTPCSGSSPTRPTGTRWRS